MTNQIQKIESTPSGNGVSVWQQVEEANKCTKIMYVQNLRGVFAQMVQRCCAMLGVNGERMPKAEEYELMLNFALDFWYNYRIEEIELAVKTNLACKFENQVPFHGYFNIDFISKVLKEYDGYKRKIMLEIQRKKASETPKTFPDTPDYIINEKLYDGLIDYVKTQKSIPQFWDWWRIYDHMTEKGMLSHLTVEWKQNLWEQVKTDLAKVKTETKLMAQSVKEIRDAETIGQDDEIKRECIRRTVHLIILPYLEIQ
jgi:hypothetical protein